MPHEDATSRAHSVSVPQAALPSPHTTPMPNMSVRRAWWLAVRPRTLPAALAPVVLGSSIAAYYGAFHLPSALLAALCAVLIQIGTNLANDYYDFVKGADTSERVGPLRVTQAGLLPPRAVRNGMRWVLTAAFGFGLLLVWRGGILILLIGVASLLCAVAYTAGPFPLAYVGLGDLFVLVFFGCIAVAGTVYVQTLNFSHVAVVAGLGPGLLATALLAVNNLRDRETDRRAGKRTLAVRFGAAFARAEYALCILGAHGVVPIACIAMGAPRGILLGVLTLPLGLWLAYRVSKTDGAALNPLLGRSAQLLLLHSTLTALGWLGSRL